MTTAPEETSNPHERRNIYIIVGIVLLVLVIIGLIAYRAGKPTREAEAKADQLITALTKAGVDHPPSKEQIVGVFGNDGGAACVDPTKALSKSILLSMLVNGAANPGTRPIIADSKVVKGQLLIIQVYCPENAPAFQQFVDKLKSDDTVKE
jgi:uncharacterized protein YpmB